VRGHAVAGGASEVSDIVIRIWLVLASAVRIRPQREPTNVLGSTGAPPGAAQSTVSKMVPASGVSPKAIV
jgi:hypothetical protein